VPGIVAVPARPQADARRLARTAVVAATAAAALEREVAEPGGAEGAEVQKLDGV
jgi:hypothetical protein